MARAKDSDYLHSMRFFVAVVDNGFASALLYKGSKALRNYDLTTWEKAAIVSGDVAWLEDHLGRLSPRHRQWLNQRLCAEIW